MQIVKFHDRSVKPPRGGWTIPLQGRMIETHSEQQLLEELLKVARANGKAVTVEMAEKQIWEYFCLREPERAKHGEQIGEKLNDPEVLTKERWGPWIWNFLNFSAARYQATFFPTLLAHIPTLMTCPECRNHWREIVQANPPDKIVDAKSACLWVNARHNEVNSRIGKSAYSYERMVAEFGAPP